MSADAARRRTAKALALWALLELALGIVALHVADRSPGKRATAVPPPATAPAPAPTANGPSTTVVVTGSTVPVTQPPGAAGARSGPAASPIEDAPPSTTPASSEGDVSAPAVAVSCHPDLALAESPDAPFSFLCTRGTTALSWPTDAIRLYTEGLTPPQTAALPVALAQWQERARFTVTLVDSAAAADVVMTGAELANDEDGYTSLHYVCSAACAYDHAEVQLASNTELTKTTWIATILHELGHVAGLNHVARVSEVMYPEIEAGSPAVYGDGDLAGFQELAKVRSRT